MFPIAIGFIDGETEDNWTWFMEQVRKAIGLLPLLAVSTDACKGLENAVKKVFPQAEQRECFRHLMQNFVKKFHGDTHKNRFKLALDRSLEGNYLWLWLRMQHWSIWCRHHEMSRRSLRRR